MVNRINNYDLILYKINKNRINNYELILYEINKNRMIIMI